MNKLSTELTRQSDVWILKLNGNVDSNTAHLMWFIDSCASLIKELTQARVKKLSIDLTIPLRNHKRFLIIDAMRKGF